MAITRTAMVEDDGTGTTGTILNNAWKQELYNQIDGLVGGWQTVPFNAANFQGVPPLIWTIGPETVLRNRVCVVGQVMFWSLYISWFSGTNILTGGAGPQLRLIAPFGYAIAGLQACAVDVCGGMAGVPLVGGLWVSTTGGPALEITKTPGGNFAQPDTPGMQFTMTMELL